MKSALPAVKCPVEPLETPILGARGAQGALAVDAWMKHVDMSLGNLADLETYLYSKSLGSTEVQQWLEEYNSL